MKVHVSSFELMFYLTPAVVVTELASMGEHGVRRRLGFNVSVTWGIWEVGVDFFNRLGRRVML